VATVDLPDVSTVEDVETDLDDSSLDNPWQAVLYNCDCHTYTQVIQQSMLAMRCSRDHTYELAWIVDHHG
jgi:ATP-dependent Clp protease adaptor protein ClpS